jgi:hypothetical protein
VIQNSKELTLQIGMLGPTWWGDHRRIKVTSFPGSVPLL